MKNKQIYKNKTKIIYSDKKISVTTNINETTKDILAKRLGEEIIILLNDFPLTKDLT